MEEENRREEAPGLGAIAPGPRTLGSRTGRPSEDPYAAELEYHLTRLSTALSGLSVGSFRFALSSLRVPAELLGQIDALLAQIKEILATAERAREVLLRPPPDAKV